MSDRELRRPEKCIRKFAQKLSRGVECPQFGKVALDDGIVASEIVSNCLYFLTEVRGRRSLIEPACTVPLAVEGALPVPPFSTPGPPRLRAAERNSARRGSQSSTVTCESKRKLLCRPGTSPPPRQRLLLRGAGALVPLLRR